MDQFFGDSAVILLIINCILYFRSFFCNNKAFKIITLYITSTVLIELSMRILGHYGYNNLFISHFYCISLLFFLSLFYINVLKDKAHKNGIKIYMVLCLVALITQYALIPNLFFKFNLFEIFITSFPVVIYSIIYLFNMLNEKREFYYVNIGVMIYITGSTIIFLSGNIINIYSPKFAKSCWTFNSILYFFYQLLIFIEWKKNYSKIKK
jgi:hypothetical protein